MYHTTSVFSCISFLNAPDDKKPGIPVKNMSNCSNKTFLIYSWRLIFSKKSNFMGLFWVSQYFQMQHKFEHIRSPVIKCWRDPIIVSSVRKNKSVRKRRDPSPLRMEPGSLCCRAFIVTRSCAALWAADLGLSGQDPFQVLIFCHTHGVTTDHHGTEWESAHFSLLTYTGSQLTFMTQNEKVIIFRDLLTRGHNWPSWHRMKKWSFFMTYFHGVTTDLLYV